MVLCWEARLAAPGSEFKHRPLRSLAAKFGARYGAAAQLKNARWKLT